MNSIVTGSSEQYTLDNVEGAWGIIDEVSYADIVAFLKHYLVGA